MKNCIPLFLLIIPHLFINPLSGSLQDSFAQRWLGIRQRGACIPW